MRIQPKMNRLMATCLAYLSSLAVQAPVCADLAKIHIDLRHPGPRVSPTLYGLFFEEINHAGDGGLNAEMVRNGSFEDSSPLNGWEAKNGAKIDVDESQP